MAADAGGAGFSGGRGMERIVPFRALVFGGQAVMTLRANTRAVADGNEIGISQKALRKRMLTAGAVTVFALDVGHTLQCRRHGGPVAVGQHRRKSPAVRRRHIVKAAVDGERIGVIAKSMALNATLAVVAVHLAINGTGEERGMGRIRVSGINVIRTVTYKSPVVAGFTSINAKISARRNGQSDVRRYRGNGIRAVVACRGDGGQDGVLSGDIRAEKGPAHQLIEW